MTVTQEHCTGHMLEAEQDSIYHNLACKQLMGDMLLLPHSSDFELTTENREQATEPLSSNSPSWLHSVSKTGAAS
jgi:hypothetical protein